MSDGELLSYESLITPIFEWVQESEWMPTFQDYVEKYFAELSELTSVPAIAVIQSLPRLFTAKAYRSCFESFITKSFGTPSRSPIEDWLSEMEDQVTEMEVKYLNAFQASVPSIYQVVHRIPEESITLRERSNTTGPIQIPDSGSTSALSEGDFIVTRIVTLDEQHHLSGTVLTLNETLLHMFDEGFEAEVNEILRLVEKYLQKDPRQRSIARQKAKVSMAPLMASMWVGMVFGEASPELDENESDEGLESEELGSGYIARITFAGNSSEVATLLDGWSDVNRPISNEFFWRWMPGDSKIDVAIWMWDPEVWVETSNKEHLDKVLASIGELLGDRIEDVDIEELMDEFGDEFDFELDDEFEEDDLESSSKVADNPPA
jgi:hypothetical protein